MVKEQPQPKVIEASHPYSKPVTYDEAALEIWPNLKDAPALRVAEKEEQPAPQPAPVKKERAPKAKKAVEQPVEQPQPKVVEPSHPYSAPVTYDEAALEIWPQLAIEDKHVFDKREAPVKEEEPKAKKASAPKARPAKAKKPVDKKPKESKPVEAPVEETKQEQPAVEQPLEEQAPVSETPIDEDAEETVAVVEETPKEKPQKSNKPKAAKKQAPSKKAAPKKAVKAVKEDEAERVFVKREEAPREKIPGRFIVKTHSGYYVNKGKYSVYKEDAKVFDDFNLAKDVKKVLGGKIVKLWAK